MFKNKLFIHKSWFKNVLVFKTLYFIFGFSVCFLVSPVFGLNMSPGINSDHYLDNNNQFSSTVRLHSLFLDSSNPISLLRSCNGTVINQYMVISSAFCANQFSGGARITTGYESTLTSTEMYLVSSIFIHPDYNVVSSQNNVAVLYAQTPIMNTTYASILANTLNRSNQPNVDIAGYGLVGDTFVIDGLRRFGSNRVENIETIGQFVSEYIDFSQLFFPFQASYLNNLSNNTNAMYWIDLDGAGPSQSYQGNNLMNAPLTSQEAVGGHFLYSGSSMYLSGQSSSVLVGVQSNYFSRFIYNPFLQTYVSFYEPSTSFIDFVLDNNPIKYVTLSRSGDWDDASIWVGRVDPSFIILNDNSVVLPVGDVDITSRIDSAYVPNNRSGSVFRVYDVLVGSGQTLSLNSQKNIENLTNSGYFLMNRQASLTLTNELNNQGNIYLNEASLTTPNFINRGFAFFNQAQGVITDINNTGSLFLNQSSTLSVSSVSSSGTLKTSPILFDQLTVETGGTLSAYINPNSNLLIEANSATLAGGLRLELSELPLLDASLENGKPFFRINGAKIGEFTSLDVNTISHGILQATITQAGNTYNYSIQKEASYLDYINSNSNRSLAYYLEENRDVLYVDHSLFYQSLDMIPVSDLDTSFLFLQPNHYVQLSSLFASKQRSDNVDVLSKIPQAHLKFLKAKEDLAFINEETGFRLEASVNTQTVTTKQDQFTANTTGQIYRVSVLKALSPVSQVSLNFSVDQSHSSIQNNVSGSSSFSSILSNRSSSLELKSKSVLAQYHHLWGDVLIDVGFALSRLEHQMNRVGLGLYDMPANQATVSLYQSSSQFNAYDAHLNLSYLIETEYGRWIPFIGVKHSVFDMPRFSETGGHDAYRLTIHEKTMHYSLYSMGINYSKQFGHLGVDVSYGVFKQELPKRVEYTFSQLPQQLSYTTDNHDVSGQFLQVKVSYQKAFGELYASYQTQGLLKQKNQSIQVGYSLSFDFNPFGDQVVDRVARAAKNKEDEKERVLEDDLIKPREVKDKDQVDFKNKDQAIKKKSKEKVVASGSLEHNKETHQKLDPSKSFYQTVWDLIHSFLGRIFEFFSGFRI